MASAAGLRLASSRSGLLVVTVRTAEAVYRRGPRFDHRPAERSAAITCCWSQPAWQRTNTLPPSAARIDRLGSRSSCVGQRAIQPLPAFRPPRALAMVSALMARRAVARDAQLMQTQLIRRLVHGVSPCPMQRLSRPAIRAK